MNTKFTFGKFVNIFLVLITILMIFNLIFGDKNIFLLQEKKRKLKNLKHEINDIVKKKNEIDFLLSEFNKNVCRLHFPVSFRLGGGVWAVLPFRSSQGGVFPSLKPLTF